MGSALTRIGGLVEIFAESVPTDGINRSSGCLRESSHRLHGPHGQPRNFARVAVKNHDTVDA